MLKTFVIVISNLASKNRHKKLPEHKDFILYYFVGVENLEYDYEVNEEEQTVYLRVADNYESLTDKVSKAMTFVDENFSNEVDGVFKTDDDIEINLSKLTRCIENNKIHKYFGLVNDVDEHMSDYHNGKCQSQELNESKSIVPKCKYCSGGGYYVSIELIKKIKNCTSNSIFEDVNFGKALNDLKVFPKHIPIKGHGAFWSVPVPLRKRAMFPYCECGAIITAGVNYCHFCDRRYY